MPSRVKNPYGPSNASEAPSGSACSAREIEPASTRVTATSNRSGCTRLGADAIEYERLSLAPSCGTCRLIHCPGMYGSASPSAHASTSPLTLGLSVSERFTTTFRIPRL
jgi:hypothetical protein